MDSIALAWWKRPDWALTIDYGQRPAEAEITAATQVCMELGIEHEVVRVDCSPLGSGDLLQAAADPHAQESDWWPYRNQLLITLAAMCAIKRRVEALLIGTVKSDGESHRDGTPTFVSNIDALVAHQEGGMRIFAPAIEMSTADLVLMAQVPPGLLAWSHSCHKANTACGQCRGCNKYVATYRELGEHYAGPS